MRLTVLAMVVLAALAAAPASASTVRATAPAPPGSVDGYLSFDSLPGEANDVTMEKTPAGFRIADLGAPLTAQTGCTTVDAHTALCDPGTGTPEVMANLGDLNDRLALLGTGWSEGTLIGGGAGDDVLSGGCQMNGGPGNDVLTACDSQWSYTDGGPGDDLLNGGTGDDGLQGGGGRDTMNGGPGNDSVGSGDNEALHDADVFDGGPGNDEVYEGQRTQPVVVDLSNPAAAQGEAGEGDVIRNVENARTGAERDTITGTDGANFLWGGGGDDVIRGLGGDDVIVGGWGADDMDGGAGDDQFTSADRYIDHIACGDGADRVVEGDKADVRTGCEGFTSLPASFGLLDGRIGMRRNRVAYVPIRCFDLGPGDYWELEWDSCAGTATVRVKIGHRWRLAGTAVCPPDKLTCGYAIKLSRSLAKVLARRRSLPAIVTYVRWPGTRGGAIPMRRQVLLKVSRQ
jgi:hypothetical protein